MKRFDYLYPFFLAFISIFILSESHTAEPHASDKKEKTFVVIIPKNTVLFDIKNKKDLKTHKKVYAKAFSSSPRKSFLTIVNHENQPRYLIDSKNVLTVQRETNLEENPKFFSKTFRKLKKDSYDKRLSINHDLIFETNVFSLSIYDSKDNSELKISKAYSSMLYDLNFQSELPFYFGISACLSKEQNQSNFILSKMDFGLNLKTKSFNYLKIKDLQLSFYGLQTFFQKTSIQDKNIDLSTSSLSIKLSKSMTLMEKYRIKLGLGGTHHLSFFTKQNDSLIFNQNSYYSYAIFIGLQHKSVL